MARPLKMFPGIVSGYELTPDMGWFSVVIPEETQNIITNPSIEYAITGYSSIAGSTLSQTITYARRGIRSLKVTTVAGNDGVVNTVSSNLVANTDYCWSFDLLAPLGQVVRAYVTDGSSTWSRQKLVQGDGKWHRHNLTFRYVSGNVALNLMTPYKTFSFYTDGWQLENKPYPTTYTDGDITGYVVNQNAFFWEGAPHSSTSRRIAGTAAGGREYKLIDLGFHLLSFVGTGLPQVENVATDLWQGGAYYQRTINKTRSLTLVGAITGNNVADLNSIRAILGNAFYNRNLDLDQPVLLKYYPSTGDDIDSIEIPAFYESGLEGSVDNKYQERLAISFIQYQPYLYADSSNAKGISFATPLKGNLFYRRKKDGTWTTFVTDSLAYQTTAVYADKAHGIVYLTGSFQDLNGVTNATIIAKYSNGVISALGTGLNVGSTVYDAFVAPNGDLYIAGNFTSAGGVAKTKWLARWSYSLNAWQSLYSGADPVGTTLRSIVVDSVGNIFVSGDITAISGVAAADIAWRTVGGTWSAIGSGINNTGFDLVVDSNDRVYVAGTFTAANGVSTGNIARISSDRSTFELLVSGVAPSGVSGTIVMAVGIDRSIYIGSDAAINFGSFSSILARYNGTGYYPLQGNIDSALDIGFLTTTTNGTLVVGGFNFWLAGVGATTSGILFYRNGKWLPWETERNFPPANTTPTSWVQTGATSEIFISSYDFQYHVLAGNTTVNNPYAKTRKVTLVMTGPMVVNSITNNTTGDTIYFNNMKIYTGETVIFKTTGTGWSISSSIARIMTPYVDKATKGFGLANGDNYISFVCDYGNSVDDNLIGSTNFVPYLGNVTDDNSDMGKIYFSVTYSAPNYTIVLYKDSGRTQQIGVTPNFTASSTVAVNALNNSGIIGYFDVQGVGGAAVANAGYSLFGLAVIKLNKQMENLVQ